MAPSTEKSMSMDASGVETLPLTCPKCGAPLPAPGREEEFVTCQYCGVRSELAKLVPPPRMIAPPEANPDAPLPSMEEGDWSDPPRNPFTLVKIAAITVTLVVLVTWGSIAISQQQQSPSTGPTAGDCSATIIASKTTGPAPLTDNFKANVTAAPGTSNIRPQWQFGPFGSGFDPNYTYGFTVNHTWNASGSYGVHLSVATSPGPGCFTSIIVNVT